MLEQILTKETVDEELRLSASASSTPAEEDSRSLRTQKSSSSSTHNSTPSTPNAVMTG